MTQFALNSEKSASDADLLTRIGIAMNLRHVQSWQALRITVNHGEVTLFGIVQSPHDREKIFSRIRHMAGVRRVIDKTSLVGSIATPASTTHRQAPREPRSLFSRVTAVVRSWFFVALAGSLVGCSQEATNRVQTYPVTGSITLKGQPVPGAFVALHPKSPQFDIPAPRANVGADGALKVTTYDGGDGAPEGEYILTIEWYKPIKSGADLVAGPNVVPKKYSSPKTSDITIRVAAQENVLPPITL